MSKFFVKTDESLPIMLLRAREAVMCRIRPFLIKHDLSEQQWRVLRILDEVGPLEPTELGERCMVLTPSLTRILSLLEKRQMIRREQHPTDRRKQIIHLAGPGQDVIAKIAPEAQKIYEDLEEHFGKPQMINLLNKLKKLSEF
ncbi:homoprotocatechuate degradation operon regulator HpaR [Neptunicoccus cionae]|uniref:homoprotocatechuate degradation operon regulator HpaR n=1 Tax=Neptunicoccus cionae TaxID=2035344 RepID=UPI000C7815CD|nr:homoprotocatechuate degradation operon regulator HpaR [Amylibacter cionae]PLS22247.1 homoprotocatechuate degradation operon regulator HpaR [Amylibacter cionae]